MSTKDKAEIDSEYHCDHCKRSFKRPANLFKHLCEQKRRWMDKDKPANRIAYMAWLQFYKQIQPTRKKKEYADFIGSAYYLGFLRFGTYCAEARVINVDRYVDYLLKEKIALDNWSSDSVYTKYLIFYLRMENGMDAVRRSVEYMLELSESEHIQLRDVFRYVNSNKLCHYISSGKISPWVVYQSKTGIEFLSNLNDDQRAVIFDYIDPERWALKFKRDGEEVANVADVLNQIDGL